MALRKIILRTRCSALAGAGLRTQLVSIILLPTVLLFAMITIAGLSDRQEQMAVTTSRVGLLAKAAAARVNDAMNAAAGMAELLRGVDALDPGGAHCDVILLHLERSVPAGIIGINRFDARGNVRCSSKAADATANVGDREWFKDAVRADPQHFVISDLHTSRVFGAPAIRLAAPVHAGDPQTDVIGIALDMSWFAELGTKLSTDEGGSVLVIDRRDGMVLGSSDRNEGMLGRRFPGHPLTVKALLPAPVWSGILPDFDGISRLFGLAVVEGPNGDYATIAVGLPERGVFAAADTVWPQAWRPRHLARWSSRG